MKKSLVIDGNSILNRAFYGIRPLSTKDGLSTNALYGIVPMIYRQVETIKPDYIAVAFDVHEPTFRHKMYDAYKAGRHETPPELLEQFPIAKELLTDFGCVILEKPGFEADDILGTLANLFEKEDVMTYIMTGDRDALQLITDKTHVLLVGNKETADMDKSAFLEKYGVEASQYVDVKALMGDSSDNIPGVKGIGEKTAFKLISDYQSLDNLYAELENSSLTASTKEKLTNGKESAYFSKILATIVKDVPLGLKVEDLENKGIQEEKLSALLRRLEFFAFIKKFHLESVSREENPFELPKQNVQVEVVENKDAVCLSLIDNYLIFFDGKEKKQVELNELPLLCKDKIVICYDAKNLYKFDKEGILDKLNLYDLMLGAYLCDSSRGNYEFPTLLSLYLGITEDVQTPMDYYLPLYNEIDKILCETGQKKLLVDIEMPLCRVLADMETDGFLVDRDGINHYGIVLKENAKALETTIYFYAGMEFNINSPRQLSDVLFETLKLPVAKNAKKTKTGYSTSADTLEKMRGYHPIIEAILEYRQLTKLIGTYIEGLLKVADENGRIHTNFKQTGTATGRLSSAEPNLQNIPIRTELGKELRRYFLPTDKNHVIIDADYSQIELRVLAHISGDTNMISAFDEGVDIHTSTASKVFHVPASFVTTELRKRAKAVNFGILYGMGAFSLSQDLEVSRKEAQEYIDSYLATYPKIDAYLKKVVEVAKEDGYTTTLLGRRRIIPELKGQNKILQNFGERVAMNSPIQGTAADIIKIAMIRVHKRLKEENIKAKLILQVHDELLLDADISCADYAMKVLKEEMENAYLCRVALTVDIHKGNTWYDAK